MIGTIVSIFNTIKEVLGFIKLLLNWIDDMKQNEAEEKAVRLKEAVERSKKAESDEEIWKSQDDIINNKP